ncbi:MAG: UPF0182 family protein [Chloroflexota bacterium]|nr:UPF0182 family protein [Chloroflexota bacterium]
MSHDLANDADPVPGPPLPGISAGAYALFRRWSSILVIAGIVVAAVWYSIGVYAEYLWHDHLGYGLPYLYITLIRTALFIIPSLLAATLISLNVYLALPLAMGPIARPLPVDFLRLCLALLRTFIYICLLVGGLTFGARAAQHWEVVILLLNQLPFGISDPQFGLDISFYAVTLQALRAIQGWFFWLTITVIGMSVGLYGFIYILRGLNFVLAPRTLQQIAGLGICLMLTLVFNHILSVYELTLSDGGVVTGATYTDINARIPVYWFLAGIALLAAVGFGISIRYAGLRLMAGAFTLWLIMFLLAGVLYPALFQRFRVNPDEFAREQPFIERNIEATRAAYGLDTVERIVYPVNESLTEENLRGHRSAIENIRLWDASPLLAAYNQLQFMELYYNFVNTDSDRYVIDGELQQVLIGARELDQERLPDDAQNWVNQRLQYTHGYGVSMTPATGYTLGEGRPEYFIQDIPIKSAVPVSRPEVYYGESPVEFAIVNGGMREVNPRSQAWNYDGEGGVPLDSYFRRLLYALKFGDVNIALSDQVTGNSRIQFHRHVRERVKTIAPFLKLDRDPYPVLDNAGKLWWIQDAYTVTDGYPYSTGAEERFNYIRNSVKAVIDAYNGGVTLYVMDPDDPILQMYRAAVPALFQPFEEMPQDLQPHIRYPVTLFSAQANLYLRYHVTDSQVFFNQAEQWDIPLETRLGKDGVRVTPAYVLLPLPGESEEEFILQMPFSPAGEKKNLVGLLVARNDPPNYGQLRSYHLPDDRQIDGPSQVEARIENDQDFSQLFTLWQGAGSEIIRGRLLAIPIADTIVYVEPLYLQSEFLEFPELKKVILADNTNLVMADTMAEGVARLTGSDYGSIPSQPAAGGTMTPDQLEQLDQIEATIDELGEALEDLERSLQNLRNTLGGNSQ